MTLYGMPIPLNTQILRMELHDLGDGVGSGGC